uniref:2-(3-amino-3-carboxypropyl)histidine synthase subunit 2 n=1 Tax=Anopheles culicifacies TaxID=139723 RepID=A0A182MNH2_9DIPT
MSSAFSSGDSVIQNQSPSAFEDHVQLHDIWNSEQKQRCLRWIEKHNLKRIALQLPDSILHHSVQIVNELQSAPIEDLHIFVLADTSYGSCCVDEIAVSHANAEGVVHFGHACLSRVARIPVLYVFFQFTLEKEHFLASLSQEFVPVDIQVTCFYEVCYTNAIVNMRDALVDRFPNMTIARIEETGENTDLLYWKLETPRDPDGLVLYVGRDNLSFFNTAVALEASRCFLYDPTKADPKLERTDALGAKWLRRRYYAIERCMDAGSIGIVVATLSTKGYLEIVARVQQLAKARGVRTYLISIGKVNPEKLANFIDIDCFVLVGCPENDIFTSREFFRPLLSAFEAEMALNRTWKEKLLCCYTTNIPDLLPNGRLYSDIGEATLKDADVHDLADVSLITGRTRNVLHRNVGDEESEQTGTCTNVASKRRNEVAQISSADQFSSRSWQGLEQNLGHDSPALVRMGRSGIPIKYEYERDCP